MPLPHELGIIGMLHLPSTFIGNHNRSRSIPQPCRYHLVGVDTQTTSAMPGRKLYDRHKLVKNDQIEEFEARCLVALHKMGLQPTGTAIPILGTRTLDRSSEGSYLSRIRAFVSFLLKYSEYDDSLPVFYAYTPKGSVTINEKAMCHFLYAKFTPKDQVVKNSISMEITNAETNTPYMGLGGWEDPEICDGMVTAITHVLENAHGFYNLYGEKCELCAEICDRLGHAASCPQHGTMGARPQRTGNVMVATTVKDAIAYIKAKSTHLVRGACQVLPSEIRDIRAYCLSSNDTFMLGIYVALLMSVELYLRKIEFASLHEENYIKNMCVMTGTYEFRALNLRVKGKKKRKKKKGRAGANNGRDIGVYRHLYMWGDDEYPDIDSKRHLMAFLYSIGWKGGFFFPQRSEIDTPPADGVYRTCITDCELYEQLNYIRDTVLRRQDKLSSHSGRKSGYFRGFAGGANVYQQMQAADHDSYEVAERYAKDAETVATINKVYQDPRQNVGTWNSPYCCGDETSVIASQPGREWQVPLSELVTGFMEVTVGVDPNHPQRRQPKFLVEKTMEWRSHSNPHDQLAQHLREIGTDRTQEIKACFGLIMNEQRERDRRLLQSMWKAQEDARVSQRASVLCAQRLDAVRSALTEKGFTHDEVCQLVDQQAERVLPTETTAVDLPLPPSGYSKRLAGGPPDDGPAPKKRNENRSGNKILHGREAFVKWTNEQKLDYINRVADPDTGSYQGGHRTWLIKANKVAKCFRHCYESNHELFIERYHNPKGKFTFQSFESRPCRNGCTDAQLFCPSD